MNREVKTLITFIQDEHAPTLLPDDVSRAIAKLTGRRRSPRKDLGLDRKAQRKAAKNEQRSNVRRACAWRAGDRCENCGAHAGESLHMDHFWGRAREESVESCWMLCPRCDRAKTENKPNRTQWLVNFGQHCTHYSYREQWAKVDAAIALEFAQHPTRRAAP